MEDLVELEARLEAARDAEAALESALALSAYADLRARAGNTPLGREARRRGADLLLKLGRNDEAQAAFDALIVDCEAAGDPEAARELALALAERAHVAYRSGDGAGLARHAERAERVARGVGTPAVVAHALRYLGIAREFAGRHAEAEATYLELLELAPDTRHLGPVCNSLGEIARASGRFGMAVSWYRRSHEEWRRTRGDEPDIVYLNNLGAALVELGQHAEGRALLDRAITEQRRTGWLAMLSETYHYRALSWLAEGDLGAATRDTVEGYLLASELGEAEMLGILLRLLARIRRRAGSQAPPAAAGLADVPPDASPVELARRSVAILEEAGKPAEVARSRWLLGEIHLVDGHPDAARPELEAAQATFEALGLVYWAEMVARALVGARSLLP